MMRLAALRSHARNMTQETFEI